MVSWKPGIRQNICSDWLSLSGFLTFCEAATEEMFSLEISTRGNICRAFFKLKVKLILLHPQLMTTQVWLDGKDDRIRSPQMPFSPALTPAWSLHGAALPRLDVGPGCVSYCTALQLAHNETTYFPLAGPQRIPTGEVVKKWDSIVSRLSGIPSTTAPSPCARSLR